MFKGLTCELWGVKSWSVLELQSGRSVWFYIASPSLAGLDELAQPG